jgi:hypothetical protein
MANSRNRGQKVKRSLHSYARQWPTKQEAEDAWAKLYGGQSESIVLAILGASLIEYELERFIRARFPRQDDATRSMLTAEDGALGTFAAKIMLPTPLGSLMT